MSAPDRPTREQVDAALARVDVVDSIMSGTSRAGILAAEVRALRAELAKANIEVGRAWLALPHGPHPAVHDDSLAGHIRAALVAGRGAMSQTDNGHLPAVRQVVEHHRAALIALSHEWRSDPSGCSGLAWGVRALDRVLLACAGETDPIRLGLAAAPPEPVEQDGLFDTTTKEPRDA